MYLVHVLLYNSPTSLLLMDTTYYLLVVINRGRMGLTVINGARTATPACAGAVAL